MKWKFWQAERDPAYDEILDRIKRYDNSDHKNVVHIRLDTHTVLILNQLKLATGVDITKMMAFAITELLREHPELRLTIDKFLKQLNE